MRRPVIAFAAEKEVFDRVAGDFARSGSPVELRREPEGADLLLIARDLEYKRVSDLLDRRGDIPVFFIGSEGIDEVAGNMLRLVLDRLSADRINERLGGVKMKRRDAAFASILAESESMHVLFDHCTSLAKSNLPILILGETGTGKELLARAMHEISGRSGRYEAINVCESSDELFADELFGHVRGAFTGADRARKGAVARAAKGTLLIDEIGDLALNMQVKLLRLLQNSEYRPLGAEETLQADVRFILATHRDLKAMVRAGAFREDLYFRISAHVLEIPPLRERRDDIPLLTGHFVQKYCEVQKRIPLRINKSATSVLAKYDFPGNVRELEGMVARAVTRSRTSELTAEDFLAPASSAEALPSETAWEKALECASTLPTLQEISEQLIRSAMNRTQGNFSAAARMIGVSVQTLHARWRKMNE